MVAQKRAVGGPRGPAGVEPRGGAQRAGVREHPAWEERLHELTPQQRVAVTHTGGPLLVVAGAGTGKTRVLVEHIVWLIGERRVPPQNILALTFTEKAAAELEERVDGVLPVSAFRPWIGTFHGFCEEVLREEAFALGLDRNFRILSAPETWLFAKRHLFDLPLSAYRPLGNPTKFVRPLVEFFTQAKDQGVTPEALAAYAAEASGNWQELAAVYRAYVDFQRREGVLDFGDLLLETLRLLKARPDVLAKHRERYPEILVDEFQDTNATQGALLELLAKPAPRSLGEVGRAPHLVVVSDDDQAIYAFRGSNVANVLRFREQFPGSELLVLTDNFRSPQALLDHAYRLIQHNNPYRLEVSAGISKRLTSRATGHPTRSSRLRRDSREPRSRGASDMARNTPAVEHRHFGTEEEELAWVAEEVLRLVDQGSSYRDIAILLRTNAQAADVVPPLLRRDIPHTVAEARGLLSRPEVRDVLAYFRLLGDPGDGRALFRLVAHPALGVSAEDRATLLTALNARRGAVLPLLTAGGADQRLSPASRDGLQRLSRILADHLDRFRTLRPSAVYLEFLERSGVLKAAIRESDRAPEVLPNLQAFLSYVRSLERGLGAGDLLEFLDVLDAASEGGEGPPAATLPAEVDAVRVLTVHAAKGLEFPVVFVVGATADRYPSRGRPRALELPADLLPGRAAGEALDAREAHVLEERRLFSVALTRARARLAATSSSIAAGSRVRRKPSPFIAEAGIPSRAVAPAAERPLAEQLALPLAAAPLPRASADAAARLSASKIADYEICPLKYRFRYLLRVPVPPHHALSFGTTIHDVLRDLGRDVLHGGHPSIEDALRLYDASWVSDGYESAAHEAARRREGATALRAYLSAHPDILTVPPAAVEASFVVALPTTRLTGRVDRIDRLPDGRVVVTDFKTGAGKGKEAETDTQLSIYALALRRAFRLEPKKLRLSFVEAGRDEETARTAEDDVETAAHVESVAERIRGGDLKATPGFHCRFCDFRDICDEAQLP